MCRQATDFTVKTMRIVNTKEIEEKINNNEISVDNLDEYIGKLENSIY